MPFPFLPAGIVLAAGVLLGALAGFGLALRLVDRAALSARGSIAPGIVAGLRTWTRERTPAARVSSPGAGEPALGPLKLVPNPRDQQEEAAAAAVPAPEAVVEEIEDDHAPTEPVRRR